MELLHYFASRIFVPEPVAHEIRIRGPQDITVKSLENTSWLEIVAAPSMPEKTNPRGDYGMNNLEFNDFFNLVKMIISEDPEFRRENVVLSA